MKEMFEKIMTKEEIKLKMESEPVYAATILALYQFVCDGGDLKTLKWFQLSNEKLQIKNKIAA